MYAKRIRENEINFCPSCKGAWLDKGELALTLGTVGDLHSSSEPKSEKITQYVSCPACPGVLRRTYYSSDQRIVVEKCDDCNGIFVDRGEITKIKEFNK